MALVEVQGLSRSFGGVKALDGLTFSVEEGEIFGLFGPDGAGKTTCLRILCGLMGADGGTVKILGRDIGRDPESIKREIGYMAQPARLYDDLTVRENIEFYADLYEVPKDRYTRRMARLLEFSGLAPFTGRLFRNLSGGMKQKVGLTCALIHAPRILYLDEPTNGVDPVSRRDFWKILYELKRENVTILVASTYLDEADRCHRVALFDRGRVRTVMAPLAMRDLLPGTLYRLTVSDRPKAMQVLRSQHAVINPSIFGAGIHFSLPGEGQPGPVKEALVSEGLAVLKLEPVEPTLEDVYLHMVKSPGEGETS